MQPANTPYRYEKIREKKSALYDSFVLKDASGIIIAAVPIGLAGPLSRAEGTAQLLTAGANHLPELLAAIQRAENLLDSLHKMADFSETVYSALDHAEDALLSFAEEGSSEARKAMDGIRKVSQSPVWDRIHDMAAAVWPLLEAYSRADRDTPR